MIIKIYKNKTVKKWSVTPKFLEIAPKSIFLKNQIFQKCKKIRFS